MKKLLLILALAVTGFASAQKGTYYLSGSIGYYQTKSDNGGGETTNSNFNFSPQVGYQFSEKWTLGISAGLSTGKYENPTDESKQTNLKAGLFAMYGIPITETFTFYSTLGAGYNSRKVDVDNDFGGSDEKGNGFYANVIPTLAINIKNGFALSFDIGGLYYETLNYDDTNTNTSQLGLSFAQGINIGLMKNF